VVELHYIITQLDLRGSPKNEHSFYIEILMSMFTKDLFWK
jgi:hypothetical protein